jgi:hypothetical protein
MTDDLTPIREDYRSNDAQKCWLCETSSMIFDCGLCHACYVWALANMPQEATEEQIKAAWKLKTAPRPDYNELLHFAIMAATMTKDGEPVEGEPYDLTNDDAVDSLHSLISQARTIMGVADPPEEEAG